MPEDKERSRIGPFSIQVPPPSPNGHHTANGSRLKTLRSALPGLVIGLIVAVTTVPRGALLRSGAFAYWWRIVIAASIGGAACGLASRGSRWLALASGSVVASAGLLLAYAIVRTESAPAASAATTLADVGRLAAWGIAVGGPVAFAAWLGKRAVLARRRAADARQPFTG